MSFAAKVLTVSDSAVAGTRIDTSGPALVELLARSGFEVVDQRRVTDDVDKIVAALSSMSTGFSGLLVSTGGTGFAPRDCSPEATEIVIEREAPGLSDVMRQSNSLGALSRGRAGTVGSCLIINVPGSPTGAVESTEAVLPLLPHALDLLTGGQPH